MYLFSLFYYAGYPDQGLKNNGIIFVYDRGKLV